MTSEGRTAIQLEERFTNSTAIIGEVQQAPIGLTDQNVTAHSAAAGVLIGSPAVGEPANLARMIQKTRNRSLSG